MKKNLVLDFNNKTKRWNLKINSIRYNISSA